MREFVSGVSQETVGSSSTDLIQKPSPESTITRQTVVFDATRDNVGTPDFAALPELARRERVRRSLISDPTKADFYLTEGALDYPPDFVEPPPYKIEGGEEWDRYERRVKAIEDKWAKRERDELTGVPTF